MENKMYSKAKNIHVSNWTLGTELCLKETLRVEKELLFQPLGTVSMDNLKNSFLSNMKKKEGRDNYTVSPESFASGELFH